MWSSSRGTNWNKDKASKIKNISCALHYYCRCNSWFRFKISEYDSCPYWRLFTAPRMRAQLLLVVVSTEGLWVSQLVNWTADWSLQSNSRSPFLDFSPIQSWSVLTAGKRHDYRTDAVSLCCSCRSTVCQWASWCFWAVSLRASHTNSALFFETNFIPNSFKHVNKWL